LLDTDTEARPVRSEMNSAVRLSVQPKNSCASQFPRISCQRLSGYLFWRPARFWKTQLMDMFLDRITLRRRERSGMVPQAVSSSPRITAGRAARQQVAFAALIKPFLHGNQREGRK